MEEEKFVSELINKLECDKERALEIYNLLEDYSLLGRNNKKKVKAAFIHSLNMDEEEADKTYNVCCSIVAKEIKNKIFHPFKKN